MMPKQLRVPGHTLPDEGRLVAFNRMGNGPGRARCSCGAVSDKSLDSTAARQRWHREHKLSVLADMTDAQARAQGYYANGMAP